MLGMARGELPELTCRVCGTPIRYSQILRDEHRVVSLRTTCSCGHSSGVIRGI